MNEDTCTGGPDGHRWVLDNKWNEKEAVKKPPLHGWEWLKFIVLCLIPIIGWFELMSWRACGYRTIGRREVWYCTKCREWDERFLPA